METKKFKNIYGPVPSRRLGHSLGVDLVPFKTCTYDCIYCQLGRTTNKTIELKEYVNIDEIIGELKCKLSEPLKCDYITLAGSGEPTLNSEIRRLIREIKCLTKIPVAVITNGSLLWMPEVKDALMEADLVIPSLDAGDNNLFQCVNRPHENISFEQMVFGISDFTRQFSKSVWLEVFLLGGITGIQFEVKKIADIVKKIRPEKVQLNTVIRPPCEGFACSVSAEQLKLFAQLFDAPIEVIVEQMGCELVVTSSDRSIEEEIVALIGRRPCTAEDIAMGLGLHLTNRSQIYGRKAVDGDNPLFSRLCHGDVFTVRIGRTTGKRSLNFRKPRP